MSNLSSHLDQSDDHKNNNMPLMSFGKRKVRYFPVYFTLGIITAALFILISYLGVSYHITQELSGLSQTMQEPVFASYDKKGATADLISKLKYYGLWEVHDSNKIPPFFINAYPADLNTIENISIKKRVFIHSLLPHALFVRQEILHKRNRLESIISRIDCAEKSLDFSTGFDYENQCSWPDFLAEEDVTFILNMCKTYRTTSAKKLLKRVDAIPISIILAQGALESSWGSSRFAREGNSVFGMWTWKTAGIVPSRREEGKTHKVKAYDNILESVRAYHLTLNRLDSYEDFRQLRRHTDNPLILAEGLTLYSERGEDYVEDIKKVILSNNLQRYDSFSLGNYYLPEYTGFDPDANKLAERSRTSL